MYEPASEPGLDDLPYAPKQRYGSLNSIPIVPPLGGQLERFPVNTAMSNGRRFVGERADVPVGRTSHQGSARASFSSIP
jgi:hypothetical protein